MSPRQWEAFDGVRPLAMFLQLVGQADSFTPTEACARQSAYGDLDTVGRAMESKLLVLTLV